MDPVRGWGIVLLLIAGCCSVAYAAEELKLDQPPAAFQKPYSPADGTTVSVNPPPFTWVPPADDLAYVLELSQSPDFSHNVSRITGIDISTAVCPGYLVPGKWYWRYGIDSGKDTATLSKVRSFTVPEDAQRLRYPNESAAMALIPKARPRLLFTSTKLADYRKRVKEGDLSHLPKVFSDAYDKHIGEELVPEPPFVKGSGFEEATGYTAIFRSTRPPMDLMERFAMSYVLTQNVEHGLEAKRRILHFFGWDPEGSTAYHSNDEPAMWVMMRGVRAYDWTADLFTKEERQLVEYVMRVRARQFYDHLRNKRKFHTNPFESHAGRTLGFLGEASIAFGHEWPEAREWFGYVLTLFWNVYPAWGQDDGGWHEGPGYYSAYMSFALHYVTALREATGVDLMEKPFFRNTPDYLLYTNPPYAKISPFGDGESGGGSPGKGNVMYWFSSLQGNPHYRWYAEQMKADQGTGPLSLVLKDDSLKGKAPTDLPQAKVFPGVGLVSLHTALGNAAEDVHFLIHSDPYGPISHAHADQNAFTIEAFGEPLAIASGYYPWYASDHHKKWSWESKSSNTITIDGGVGQVVRDPKSKGAITGFIHTDDYDYVQADATAAYQGRLTKFVRQVVHVRPGIFVIFDQLDAHDPVTYEWRLHALSEMNLEPEIQQLTVSQGKARLLVRMFQDAQLSATQTYEFDVPPENDAADQWHAVVSPLEKAKAYTFLTVLVPYKEGGKDALPIIEPIASDTGRGVKIDTPEGTHHVAFKTTDKEGKWGVYWLETDGEAVAVHARPDGAFDRTLVYNGEKILESLPNGTTRDITKPKK
ncbi:MAG: DUF4962 domain-containing protein [bacterium]|nr:DUF4962 domain-containing protein [bacterium]